MTRFIRLDEPSNTLETRCDTHLFIAEMTYVQNNERKITDESEHETRMD